MSKWQVKKIPNYFFSPDRLEWVAWLDGNWAECRGFRTHAEALAYADERARTREVVLPRIKECGNRVPGAPGLLLGWENHIFWLADHGSDFIRITPAELRPLAAALLSLAEREEQP